MRGESLHKAHYMKTTGGQIPTVQQVSECLNYWLKYHNSKPCPHVENMTIQECLNTVPNKIKDRIEKYKSIGHICKSVRCVETGQIFDSARKASEWVEFVLKINYCDFNLIKAACRRTNGASYGYHWEFVKE